MTTPPIVSTLRRFTPRRRSDEQCDLCRVEIAERHHHLLEVNSRKVACACDACALLFNQQEGGRYRRIPAAVRYLPQFSLTDAQWDELAIPIELAFFFRCTRDDRVVALYPSAAGAVESRLPLDAWQSIAEANRVVDSMQTDVEALLVNRIAKPAEIFIAPIDECYRLVGLVRANWRGFSGGADVWTAIADYFADLKRRADA